jgi:hypothetical protein
MGVSFYELVNFYGRTGAMNGFTMAIFLGSFLGSSILGLRFYFIYYEYYVRTILREFCYEA